MQRFLGPDPLRLERTGANQPGRLIYRYQHSTGHIPSSAISISDAFISDRYASDGPGKGAEGEFEEGFLGNSITLNNKPLIVEPKGFPLLHYAIADWLYEIPYLRPAFLHLLAEPSGMLGAHQIAIMIVIDLYQLRAPKQ